MSRMSQSQTTESKTFQRFENYAGSLPEGCNRGWQGWVEVALGTVVCTLGKARGGRRVGVGGGGWGVGRLCTRQHAEESGECRQRV